MLYKRIIFLKILLVTFICLFSLTIRLVHLKTWVQNEFFYYKNNPLLSTVDGYYYLRIARDLVEGSYEIRDHLSPIINRPYPPPLLSVITAFIHKISGFGIEKIAFYLPCFLSLFLVLVFYLWSRYLGNFWFFVSAALLGMSNFYWCFRTSLGRFDTDCLIPFFVYLISYLAVSFLMSQGLKKILYLTIFVLIAFLFEWWWQFGLLFSFFLFFVPYAGSIFFFKGSKLENILRMLLLISFSIFLCLIFILPDGFWPNIVQKVIFSVKNHVSLLFNNFGSFPKVGASISELNKINFISLLLKLSGGQLYLIFFSIIGFFYFVRHKKFLYLYFLFFPALLGFLSFVGVRFLILLVPIYAFCLAGFLFILNDLLKRYVSSFSYLKIIVIICFVVVLVLNSKNSWSVTSLPIQRRCEVFLAVEAKKTSQKLYNISPNAIIFWNWWDYGYLIEYFARSRVFIDNGSQDPLRVFISAFPFAVPDPKLAKNWISFFSIHGTSGFYKFQKFLKSPEKTLNFFKEIFSEKFNKNYLTKKYTFLANQRFWNYLFPKRKQVVIFYMPYQMFRTSYWWYYYGTWSFEKKVGKHPFLFDFLSGFSFDKKYGKLIYNDALFLLKGAFEFQKRDNKILLKRYFFKNKSSKYFFNNFYAGHSFLIDQDLFNSTFVQNSILYNNFGFVKIYPYCGLVQIINLDVQNP